MVASRYFQEVISLSYRRDDYEPRSYMFPVNMADDGGVFGGWFKKRNLAEALVLVITMFVLWKFFSVPLPMIGKVILFIVLVLPPPIVAVFGIGHRSLVEFIVEMISQSKRSRVMIFKVPRKEATKKGLFSKDENDENSKKNKKQKEKENKKAKKALAKKEKQERKARKKSRKGE